MAFSQLLKTGGGGGGGANGHLRNSCISSQMKLNLVVISNRSCLPQIRKNVDDFVVFFLFYEVIIISMYRNT